MPAAVTRMPVAWLSPGEAGERLHVRLVLLILVGPVIVGPGAPSAPHLVRQRPIIPTMADARLLSNERATAE